VTVKTKKKVVKKEVSFAKVMHVQKKMNMTGREGRYALYGIKKIGYVDIEAMNLKPQIGHAVSIVNLVRDTITDRIVDTRVYRMTKQEHDSSVKRGVMDPDKRIVQEFFQDTVDCDLLIGHWFHGRRRFDMPFLRTRAKLMKIDDDIPNFGYWRFGDTWRHASQTIIGLNNKLDTLGRILGAPVSKTRLSGTEWWLAGKGDKRGMDYVVDHNIKDCRITYKVHKELERFNGIPGAYV